MSILARQPPPLVHVNGRRLKRGPSKLAMVQGITTQKIRQDRKEAEAKEAGYPEKRAKLMIAAKANLHVTQDIERGRFVVIDPETMDATERAEAEANGIASRTLVLHPEDLDRAIEQFSAPKLDS